MAGQYFSPQLPMRIHVATPQTIFRAPLSFQTSPDDRPALLVGKPLTRTGDPPADETPISSSPVDATRIRFHVRFVFTRRLFASSVPIVPSAFEKTTSLSPIAETDPLHPAPQAGQVVNIVGCPVELPDSAPRPNLRRSTPEWSTAHRQPGISNARLSAVTSFS